MGERDQICQFCNAIHFVTNKVASKKCFKYCCFNNKYVVEDVKYPELIKRLFLGDHPKSENFLSNIRSFNCSLALASINSTFVQAENHGPPVLCIAGQYVHTTPKALENSKDKKFSQLYFVDTETAISSRTSYEPNKNCDEDLLKELDVLLRKINPYCQIYINTRKLVKERNIQNIQIYFTKKK